MRTRFCIVLFLLHATTIKCFEEFNFIERIRANLTTSQSSIFSPYSNPQDFNSGKAIDGVQNYSIDHCKCCSVTNGDPPSWWQIDLKQKYLIGGLQIFGRAANYSSQLEFAKVYASNVSMKPGIVSDKIEVYDVPSMNASTRSFTEQLNAIIAQYFLVELNQKVLTLCEFKLNEKECKVGNFGSECLHSCHCSDNNRCDQVTGKCQTPGCLAGWTGEACEDDCPNGTFGLNCYGICNCKDDSECRKKDGNCSNGCAFGWSGFNCSKDLNLIKRIRANVSTSQSSIYSPHKNPFDFDSSKAIDGVRNYSIDSCACCSVTNCSSSSWWQIDLKQKYLISAVQLFGRESKFPEQLEHAAVYAGNESMGSNMSSDKILVYTVPDITDTRIFTKEFNPVVLQYFLVQLSGNFLTLCEFKLYEKECKVGNFGSGCLHSCHCSDKNGCHQVSGKCQTPGCLAGWKGEACTDACSHRTFGEKCSSVCHCYNNTNCDAVSGKCHVANCDPGWRTPSCNITCDHRRFGQNCTSVCHCLHNASCKTISGECVNGICDPGWQTHSCDKACGHRRFGQNCSSVCHCLNNASCNTISGECNNGICDPGWQTPSCNKVGDYRTFSLNCSSSCNCLNNTNCNSTTGECNISISDISWQGSRCDQVCDHRSFGCNCSLTCHCLNNTTCNSTTGNCVISLCDSGWQGPRCDQECDHRSFGYNCSSSCHCLNNTNCNSITGICNTGLCDPGWQGQRCDQECNLRSFGYNCSSTCHCLNNTNCNSTTGTCNTGLCDPGWQEPRCDRVCDNRTFGVNCSSTCNCLNNTNCNSTTGVCDNGLCDSGWQGPACDLVCNSGTFGHNCSASCHCLNESHCNSTTGECQIKLCESGWQGPACDQACDNRTFGYNCSSTCHCYNGTSCNSSTGDCDAGSCDSGWQGLSCNTVCNHRRFGKACSSSCHCLNDTNCKSTTGECGIGLCDPGWQGYSCDKVCSNRRFGFNCSNTCHCYDNATCDETTGVCTGPGSCEPGWEGSSCSKVSAESTDNSSGSTGAAVGGAVGATVLVFLGVVIGFILFRRIRSSKKNNGQETNFSHLDEALSNRTKDQRRTNQCAHVNRLYEDEQETSMAGTSASDYYSFNEHLTGIKIHELWDYIRNKMENKCEQLISEFKTLQQGLVHPCRSADHISNRGKNRYKDMYAYDHTRVILDDDCEPGEDIHGGYINACYIDGYEKVKKFVASQGPTKNMVDDFWRMIWQLKSDKIVMLTNLIEMGTTKCLQYWPKEEDGETECTFGDIVIRLLETDKYLDYNIRTFETTKNGEESRRIRQFHFKSWPDKDVPDSTWCLVNFWRVVDTNIASNAGPIVVHCSAGVGRTGTFIGLDNLVNQARMEGCIRPLQVVQNLRSQRVNMVQTKEQYIYLHEAAADAMYFGTHIIWTKQFRDVLEFMIQKDKVDARTRLQIQFELIEKSVVNSSLEIAESPEYSNVDTLLTESAAYRPKFMNKGTTFVQRLGAMCITNYKGKSTFLVSMSPDKDAMEEFWSLVDDNNIKTVIMLTEQSSQCYQSSCELGSGSGNRFSVNKIEEKRRKGYTQRTFTFKESVREEEDHLTTLKQFEYTAWKDGYPAPGDTTSFLDMIEAVLKWQPHFSESQPVLVYCGDGCTRTGIVCVLLNELQRMKYEGGHVNIVESVKMMKKRQRHLISSYEQYKFCFDLIMDHIKRTEDYQNL